MTEERNVLLDVQGLKKYFSLTGRGLFRRTVGHIRAVDDVSFQVHEGETVGVVCESGCRKTTLGRCIAKLYEATDGKMYLSLGAHRLSITDLDAGDARRAAQPAHAAVGVRVSSPLQVCPGGLQGGRDGSAPGGPQSLCALPPGPRVGGAGCL